MKADLNLNISLEVDDLIELLKFLKGRNAQLVRTDKKGNKENEIRPSNKYSPELESLVDVVCRKKSLFHATMGVLASLTHNPALYFNENGIASRFITSDRSSMLDLRISKELFDVYHVRGHVKMLFRSPINRSRRLSFEDDFHLLAPGIGNSIKVGEMNYERTVDLEAIEASDSPYPAEELLPNTEIEAGIEVPLDLFMKITSGSSWWEDDIFIVEKDKLTFISGPVGHQLHKVLTPEKDDVRIEVKEPISFKVRMPLYPLRRLKSNTVPRIRITKQGSAVCLEPIIKGVSMRYYLPIVAEEKHAVPEGSVPLA